MRTGIRAVLVGAALALGLASAAETAPRTERVPVIETGGFSFGFGGHRDFRGHGHFEREHKWRFGKRHFGKRHFGKRHFGKRHFPGGHHRFRDRGFRDHGFRHRGFRDRHFDRGFRHRGFRHHGLPHRKFRHRGRGPGLFFYFPGGGIVIR